MQKHLVSNDILIPFMGQLLDDDQPFNFTPGGVSMRPWIEHGRDSVVISPMLRPARVGDIVLARAGRQGYSTFVLHRVLRLEPQEDGRTQIVLMGDGNLQGEENCYQEDIYGYVTRITDPWGRRKPLTRGWLWQQLLPIRWLLLKVYRHTWLKWHYGREVEEDTIQNKQQITYLDMKTIKGFKLRQLGNEYILVGESVELVNFNKMITMNETAAFLWRKVEDLDSFDALYLSQLLLDEYEVEPEQALRDSEATIQSWLEAGIVE